VERQLQIKVTFEHSGDGKTQETRAFNTLEMIKPKRHGLEYSWDGKTQETRALNTLEMIKPKRHDL